jgi:hypothetical protein
MASHVMAPGGGVVTAATVSSDALPDARLDLGRATLDDLFPAGKALRRSLSTYVVLLSPSALER